MRSGRWWLHFLGALGASGWDAESSRELMGPTSGGIMRPTKEEQIANTEGT